MRKLIGRLKYRLFRRLMDELCAKSGDCKTCPCNSDPNNERDLELKSVGGRLFDCACCQTDVYAQAYRIWMVPWIKDEARDAKYA